MQDQNLDFLINRLDNIYQELNGTCSSLILEESIGKLKEILSTKTTYVDLFIHSSATNEVREWQERLTKSLNSKYFISIKHERENGQKEFGNLCSAIAIVALDRVACNSATFKSAIEKVASRYSFLLIIDFTNVASCKEFAMRLGGNPEISVSTLDEFKSKSLPDLLKLNASKIDRLNKISHLKSVEPLFTIILLDIFNVENGSLRTREVIDSQTGAIVQKGRQSLDLEDLSNSLKQQLRRTKNIAIDKLSSKYKELNKHEGKYAKFKKLKAELLSDTDFDYEPTDEKNERVTVKIKKTYQDDLVKDIKDLLINEFSKDACLFNEIIGDTLSSINVELNLKAVRSIELTDIITPILEKEKTLDDYAHISRQFSSDFTKKKTRDYIDIKVIGMIFSFIAGLIGNMLAGKFNKPITIISAIPIILIILNLIKSIPKKKKEESYLLLKDARELIEAEIERIYSDATKDWVKNISIWFDEIENDISIGISKNIKESNRNKRKKSLAEKADIDKTPQGIFKLQRRIQTAEKICKEFHDQFTLTVADTAKELKKTIVIVHGKKESSERVKKVTASATAATLVLTLVAGGVWYSHKKNDKLIGEQAQKVNDQALIDLAFKAKKYEQAKRLSLHLFENNQHDQYIYAASVKELGDTSIKGSSESIFEKCAQAGDKDCQYQAGMNAYNQEKYDDALYWFNKSSSLDKSQCQLGYMYLKGVGTEKNRNKAFGWYSKAAKQNNEIAMYSLGIWYAEGEDTPYNKEKAKSYLIWAATYAQDQSVKAKALSTLKKLEAEGVKIRELN